MEVTLSTDRKTATLHYPHSGKTFQLHHSEGEVQELVILFLSKSSGSAATLVAHLHGLEETVVIDLPMAA